LDHFIPSDGTRPGIALFETYLGFDRGTGHPQKQKAGQEKGQTINRGGFDHKAKHLNCVNIINPKYSLRLSGIFYQMPDFTTSTVHFSQDPMDLAFDIRYTDRLITPFGGLITVKNCYQNSGLQDVISSLPLP